MDTVYFSQVDNPLEIDADIYIPDMALVDPTVRDCSQNYTSGYHTSCVILAILSLYKYFTLGSLHLAAAKELVLIV